MRKRKPVCYILLFTLLLGAIVQNGNTSSMAEGEGGAKHYILCYTRETDDSIKRNGNPHGMYQSAVTDSMHLGYSTDGKNFEALNYNTGVLFVPNEGENTKVLKYPSIFRMKDGKFGIVAVRADEGGEKADTRGQLLFWTSEDLLSYSECKLLTVGGSDTVKAPNCRYDAAKGCYRIQWTSEESGQTYENETTDFSTVKAAKKCEAEKQTAVKSGIPYAIEGNVLEVSESEAKRICNRLKPVVNTTIDVAKPEVPLGEVTDVSNEKVTAHYSDGSTAKKSVTWNAEELAKIDYNTEGTYEVTGIIRQLKDKISSKGNYPFLEGRADPNIVKFRGKYYFVATSEPENVNFYIRESDTVAGLNEAEETKIYDEAKGKKGGIISKSNHWAPELHIINKELYMFFGSNTGTGWDVQSMIMKLKTGGDPTDYDDWEAPKQYKNQKGRNLNTEYGGITLDMTHFSYDNRHYVVWSQRNFGKNGGTADLWIGETSADNPGKLISKAVLIVPCEYGWERNHTPVTEGPFVIMTKDKLYLTYSGGATDETYCVGMTQIDLKKDVDFLDAASWKKNNYPILTGLSSQSEQKYHGPGHNSYVTDEDGNFVNAFHARPGEGNLLRRDAFLRIVHFGIDGTPLLDMEEDAEVLPENRNVKMIVTVKEGAPRPTPSPTPEVWPTRAPDVVETPTPVPTQTAISTREPANTATAPNLPTAAPTQAVPAAPTSDKVKAPDRVAIYKISNKKGKKMQITLRKAIKRASGYEIQYALQKNMRKAKKTVVAADGKKNLTIKKLKKKTYYVCVRAYILTNGGKIHGRWSEKKSVKIRK